MTVKRVHRLVVASASEPFKGSTGILPMKDIARHF